MWVKRVLEKTYWTWTVLGNEIYHTTPSWRKIPMVLCKCECWVEKYVQRSHLLSWSSKNCGCLNVKRFIEMAKESIHGMEWTIPYKKYMAARARCNNPKNDSYYRYWWRGIKFEWENFVDFWNDMWPSYYEHIKEYWEKNTTLDRIDVNWNYCKENCRWATWKEQYNNMSTNHGVSYKWQRFPTISELCRFTWKKYGLVRDRIRWGWSIEDAVDLPLWYKRNVKKKLKRKTV